MLFDVFSFMRTVTKKINEYCDGAYPNNQLSESRGVSAINTIVGIVSSIEAVIGSKVADVESKGQRFRSITDDDKETEVPLDFEPNVSIESLSVDYYRFIGKYCEEINAQIAFFRKNTNAVHSTVQRIRGVNCMMVHFLESLEGKK